MVKIKTGLWALLFFAVCLSGCSLQPEPVLAVPKQISYEDEVKIAELSYQLSQTDIDDSTRMRVYFERAIAYDSVGMKSFAQSDFTQVLRYNSAIPDVYNFLGIYAMREGDFGSAFLAFNTALEIDPEYVFAYFNRAIALYRTERYEAAQNDALKFYQQDKNSPIPILWLYLIEKRIDAKQANIALQQRYDSMMDKTVWGSDIIAFYLGHISESRLMLNVQKDAESNQELAERLCEMYFYLGKYHLDKGNQTRAEQLFKYALVGNIYGYVEYQQAFYEIRLLNQE